MSRLRHRLGGYVAGALVLIAVACLIGMGVLMAMAGLSAHQ